MGETARGAGYQGDDLPIHHLLDSAPDGFIVADDAGTVIYANQTAERQFGYERRELGGRNVGELIPGRLQDAHTEHMSSYMEDPRVRPMGLGLDLVGRRKDGSEFPVEISLSPIQMPETILYTAVVRDISMRKEMEEERMALEMELETERERDRIAMDLHDGIMQDIYASSLALELALTSEDEGQKHDAMERVIQQLQRVVLNIRSYIFDLRPREFGGDLAEAISNLASEFEQNSQIATEVSVDLAKEPLLPTCLAVYTIAHEGLSNVQRHSGASQVHVSLESDEREGRLVIADDGGGFDTGADRGQSHRGLRNMFNRARSVEADLDIDSAPGKGTRLSLRFPTSA